MKNTKNTANTKNHSKQESTGKDASVESVTDIQPKFIWPGISDAALQQAAEIQNQKLMIVAICPDQDGQMLITPIDVEHEIDDLTPMTDDQLAERKLSDETFCSAQGGMMKALGALYGIFSRRLYRNQFRTFENFCFAMYGTHRINDVLMKKVKARAKALRSDVNDGL